MTKQFFIERYEPAHQKNPLIQFATHVPRSLTVADAQQLVKELQEVLGKDAVASKSEPPKLGEEKLKKTAWGK